MRGLAMNVAISGPEIGEPINVRLGDDLLGDVDRWARANEVSRAEAIRQLVYMGLRVTDR